MTSLSGQSAYRTVIGATDLVPDELDPAARALLAARARHGIGIGVLGTHARAHFDLSDAAERFARRYHDLASTAPAALRTYAVADRATMRFWVEDGPAYAWPYQPLPPHAIAFLADAVTTHALLSAIPADASLHAAALRRGAAAFALTGLSEAGKSTTALACIAAGCAIYSDERCIVRDGCAVAYPRALSLRSGGVELLTRDLPPGPLRERLRSRPPKAWESVRIAELVGDPEPPAPAPLRALFAIVGRDAQPRSRRIPPVAMLRLVHPGAHVAEVGIDRVRRLLELLDHIACYELVLGDPYATALHVCERVDAMR